jgi:hypothetical protein
LLALAARTAPVSWAQRLGYLLELIGHPEKTGPLLKHVRKQARRSVPLLSTAPHEGRERDPSWKLYVNAEIVPELLV